MLYGEDGASQTKELQVPGCTLFRRNSRDTFLFRLKCKFNRMLLIKVMQSEVKCLVRLPQCGREFGPPVGASHLARQLWPLPQLVPEAGGGV